MNHAHTLSIATRQGIPLPHAGAFTATDRAWLLWQASFIATPTAPFQTLDYVTFLHALPEPIEAVTTRWATRISAAALTKTHPGYAALLPTQDAWNATLADPASAAWAPYLKDTARSKSGRTMAQVRALHNVNFRATYTNALEAYNRMFEDAAARYLQQISSRTPRTSRGMRKPLSLEGTALLALRGPIAKHILLLCGNPALLTTHHVDARLSGTFFPSTPFVPPTDYPALSQALLGTLIPQGMLALRGLDYTHLNATLDDILTTYLDPTYAGPPQSYTHLTSEQGRLQLRTHIESA